MPTFPQRRPHPVPLIHSLSPPELLGSETPPPLLSSLSSCRVVPHLSYFCVWTVVKRVNQAVDLIFNFSGIDLTTTTAFYLVEVFKEVLSCRRRARNRASSLCSTNQDRVRNVSAAPVINLFQLRRNSEQIEFGWRCMCQDVARCFTGTCSRLSNRPSQLRRRQT